MSRFLVFKISVFLGGGFGLVLVRFLGVFVERLFLEFKVWLFFKG